ncbi:potassium channel family protein [Spirochaetota bacterium]
MKIMTTRRRKVLKNYLFLIINHNAFIVFIMFVGILLIGSFGIYYFELARDTGEKGFMNVINSVWYTIVTISTVGYGDITPSTWQGKMLGFVLIIFGVAITGTITASISSFLVGRQLKEDRGLTALKKLSDHFIICGYKHNMADILDNILKVNPELNADEIVMINQCGAQIINSIKSQPKFASVHFVFGDFIDEASLLMANIKKARTGLILVDELMESSTQEKDARTVMAVMTIKNLNKNMYLCAEILDSKFEKQLQIHQCDEIILTNEYSRILLANASSGTGLSNIITDIIDVDSDSRVMTSNIPDKFIEKTFKELQEYFYNKNKSVCIGILENTGNIYQRKKDALKEAQKTPNIEKLVLNLHTVKMIQANEPVINPDPEYKVKLHSKAINIPCTNIGVD